MLLWRAARSLKGIVQHRFSEPARQLPFPRRTSAFHWQAEPSSLNQARTIYNHLISRLKTNLSSPALSRSLHSSHPSSHQSASFASRNAPRLGAPCLPRPPRVPGNVSHVGLGTARNFSTARPVFQHLVENVPVAGRAINEIDWDLKIREQRRSFALGREKTSKPKHQIARPVHKTEIHISIPAVADAEEVQHYFHTPATPSVTTYLQIPLAPTPTSRVPLSSSSTSPPCLLPLSALAREHALHSKHAVRVSSLFKRLDAANVWERGGSCKPYGDPLGLCTVLRVRFEGWTEDMVREVLGLAGGDWCSIQEIVIESTEPEGPTLSDVTPVITPETLHQSSSSSSDVTFVMPTIDMSVGSEWDAATASWATMPLRSSSPMSDEGSEYSFPGDSGTPSEGITELSPPNSRSASPNPSLINGSTVSVDFEWDAATASWATMPLRSSRLMSEEGSEYSFPDDSGTPPEGIMELSPPIPEVPLQILA
ncbi:hypothetical protein BU17DRAFT_89184 [Hysterangium stoloniferum]|nr:hypothetical protein BU17DRAFT_89184 [Hysterangium stoloniferum]